MEALPPLPTLPITSQETLRKCRALDCSSESHVTTIFIASFPKSGTTWMQNIVFQLLAAHKEHTHPRAPPLPPLEHISQYAPFYEIDPHWEASPSNQLIPKIRAAHQALGEYRIFNTHLRWDMLPKGSRAKYIYVVRDGRDVLTSFYHHLTNQHEDDGGFVGDFEDFFRQFLDGTIAYGKWSHHLASWMPNIVGNDETIINGNPQILLVRYEDLKKDLKQQVVRIAQFLELDEFAATTPTDDDNSPVLNQVLERVSFAWMREHQDLFHPVSVRWKTGYHFIRTGRVGDHDNLFDEEHKKIFVETIMSDFGGKDQVPSWLNKYCFHADDKE